MLHPQFTEIAARIKALKEKYRPNVSLTLLTNSSLVMKNDIANSIVSIEFPIFKLDCGDESTFRTINRPVPELKITEIIASLKRLAKRFKITIQTVLVNDVVPNIEKGKFEQWLVAIKDIKPAAIQIYSTDRPVADSKVKMLSKAQLEEFATLVAEKTGISTQAYSI
jgi:wyosine [tRNA(Phe)-imidazoG37] synthetase (radical SAM superfamily)